MGSHSPCCCRRCSAFSEMVFQAICDYYPMTVASQNHHISRRDQGKSSIVVADDHMFGPQTYSCGSRSAQMPASWSSSPSAWRRCRYRGLCLQLPLRFKIGANPPGMRGKVSMRGRCMRGKHVEGRQGKGRERRLSWSDVGCRVSPNSATSTSLIRNIKARQGASEWRYQTLAPCQLPRK